jgi:PD-(D/E)XK nuclease superfamily
MLNNAVDHLLKQEFDIYRTQGTSHPLMQEYGVSARPVEHEELEKWRHNFTGIQYHHPSTNIVFYGAIDDLWKDTNGEYIVVDYKATARDYPVTELSESSWNDSYRRQIEFYQWLLTMKGLKVSKKGYFVYCTGRKGAKSFDAKLEFDIRLISFDGAHDWIEPTVEKLAGCLQQQTLPEASPECSYCQYRKKAADREHMQLF